MHDQKVRELRPCFGRHDGAHVGFDDFRVRGVRKSDQPGQTPHVRVDRESGLSQCIAEHHICGFSADAGELEQFLHGAGDFAVEMFDKGLSRFGDMRRFRPIESAGENGLFEFVPAAFRERFRVRPPFEKIAGDHIHAFVRALGGKDRGDEELKRRHVLQKTFLGTVDGQQFVVDLFCQCGFHICAGVAGCVGLVWPGGPGDSGKSGTKLKIYCHSGLFSSRERVFFVFFRRRN